MSGEQGSQRNQVVQQVRVELAISNLEDIVIAALAALPGEQRVSAEQLSRRVGIPLRYQVGGEADYARAILYRLRWKGIVTGNSAGWRLASRGP